MLEDEISSFFKGVIMRIVKVKIDLIEYQPSKIYSPYFKKQYSKNWIVLSN